MTWLPLAFHILLTAGFGLRILLRDDLRPDVRMGWLTVIVLLPYVSCVLYFLFGEVTLGRLPWAQQRKRLNVRDYLRAHGHHASAKPFLQDDQLLQQVHHSIAPAWQNAFSYAASINGFAPAAGHHAQLMDNGSAARQHMLQDMHAAQREIHVLYYIWLADHTGAAVAQALIAAARRGVTCRAMVDGLGSRALINSSLWQSMADAGVQLRVALPIHQPLKVVLSSRIDLRNHRKITLIDGQTTYCGSQNCADEAFLPKARYAPWVDIMLRIQGPLVGQLQWVFASDWAQSGGAPFTPALAESLSSLEAGDMPTGTSPTQQNGFAALAIAEGPTERTRSTPQLVSTLLASAQRELVITTPYFVPDATVLEALCAAAWRGVDITLIVPARNDSWIVGAASRSSYRRLLAAGLQIREFEPGLLHAKTICIDGEVSLIGSTNLDLRSFDLNFENNVLLQDQHVTSAIRSRQDEYIAQCRPITMAQVNNWPWHQRIWHHLMAMLSPLL